VVNVKLALVVSAAALAASACVGQPPGELDEGAEIGSAEEAVVSSQCLNYQRGASGAVADTTLWESAPTYNDGAYTSLNTGTSSGGFKQALARFDIGNIPAGAHVDSATLTLYMSWKASGSTVDIHEVLVPWTEGSVTWASFDAGFDPDPSVSFLAWGGGGTLQIHVEELVQKWVDGESENHGFLFQELDGRTSYHSSEHAAVSSRPKLKVCYTVTP
jgi:hypothetical protein